MNTYSSTKLSPKDMCYIAVFTAIISICAQISIPMPAGVPMTLQTLIIPIAGIVLGTKRGTAATLLYVALGTLGLPVFANFSGGAAVTFGMTGGFILSFPLLALCAGIFSKNNNKLLTAAGLILGMVLNYAVGCAMFMAFTGNNLAVTLGACVVPFIPTSILKIILAESLGFTLKKAMLRAGILEGAAA